ncbi:MAG: hypothetical protein ACYC0Z_02410 [Acidobacteriaceae bacterium]
MESVVMEAPAPPTAQTVSVPPAFVEPMAKPRTAVISAPMAISVMTILATLVHGYHPYAEDAGIYIAGIKLALNPKLYPFDAEFVTAHTHFSIFSTWIAAAVRLTHLPLEYVLFGIQVVTTWLLLFSCWQVAKRCFASVEARWGAVSLVAACLTLPVAGTSLFIMDPYVTGRSFSTPYILLAICACLDRKWLPVVLGLAVAAAFHPLMAIYAAGFLLMLWAVLERRWVAVASLCIAAVAMGGALQWSQHGVVESAAYVHAALTRTYFYLSEWEWYEWIGLIAPMLMMLAFVRWQRSDFRKPAVALCATSLAIGLSAVSVSLLYSRVHAASHLVARLQTLRSFHIVYIVFFILLGGVLGQYWLKRIAWRWVTTFAAIAVVMFLAQQATYPASAHLETPWAQPHNGWTQAFVWIRSNTPVDAVFALDAHYITMKDEDAQGFRAAAERSALADYSKDGGATAVFPQLAADWMAEYTADMHLSQLSDQQRIERLKPFGVTWVVLQASAKTSFDCPYVNADVRVCKLPQL